LSDKNNFKRNSEIVAVSRKCYSTWFSWFFLQSWSLYVAIAAFILV